MNAERILVVEDDPDTAELLRIIIGAEGFAAKRNAFSAWRIARRASRRKCCET